MPIPVSVTVNATRSAPAGWAASRTSPRSVNLIALVIRLRRTWVSIASSVRTTGTDTGSSTITSTPGRAGSPWAAIERIVPRRAPNRACRSTVLHLGEVQQLVDQAEHGVRRVMQERQLPLLLVGERIGARVAQQAYQAEDRGHRGPQLVADVGEEPVLRLVRLSQLGGSPVQFGVEREHAPVGFGQLLGQLVVQPFQLLGPHRV